MKTKIGLALLVVAILAAGTVLVSRNRARPPVGVTLRIAVDPVERLGFVIGEANSARFKYLMGKQSGVKPVLAQRLSVKRVPNSSLLEARIGVLTKDEARLYAEVFLQTLQDLCGSQARLALAEHTVPR
jgi:hypothetical protein